MQRVKMPRKCVGMCWQSVNHKGKEMLMYIHTFVKNQWLYTESMVNRARWIFMEAS